MSTSIIISAETATTWTHVSETENGRVILTLYANGEEITVVTVFLTQAQLHSLADDLTQFAMHLSVVAAYSSPVTGGGLPASRTHIPTSSEGNTMTILPLRRSTYNGLTEYDAEGIHVTHVSIFSDWMRLGGADLEANVDRDGHVVLQVPVRHDVTNEVHIHMDTRTFQLFAQLINDALDLSIEKRTNPSA